MNEPIFNSVHHFHRPYTIAIKQQWLTPGVSNCMVFNFKVTKNGQCCKIMYDIMFANVNYFRLYF